MAIEFSGLDMTFTAAEDLSSYQYKFVVQATDTTVELGDTTDDSEVPVGILQNAPASGGIAVVRVKGTSKLVMNSSFSVGDEVKMEVVDTEGDSGKGAADAAAGDKIRGICIQAAGAEDDVGGVLLCLYERQAP